MTCRWTAMVGLVLILGVSSTAVARTDGADAGERRDVQQGVIVMKLRDGYSVGPAAGATGLAGVDRLMNRYGVRDIRQVAPLEGALPEAVAATGIAAIYNVPFSVDADPRDVAAAFAADPDVEYAEPKYLYEISDTPNDPLYGSMTQFAHVGAPAAWDVVKGQQGGVVVAVVDGGTDWDHPDLVDNIWNNAGETPGNGVDDDGNGFVDDVRGWNFANNSNDPTGLPNTPLNANHGTHVAGTAAGRTDNGAGVASISWNCILMPIGAGSATSDRIVAHGYDGIAYAAANGADVINCSWGGAGNPSSFERDIIEFARASGAVVVAAAGNDGVNNDLLPHYPGSYDGVLSVGATFKTSDARASFSNYGASVSVFAPGVSIYSTVAGGGYQSSWSGTSMASPMVAGLVGLLQTAQPGWTPDQLREQVRVSSDPIDNANPGFQGLVGKGRINAQRAVTDFTIPSLRIADLTFTDSGGDGVIDAGETVDLTISFINYLAATSNVAVTLSTTDANITVINAGGTIPSIAQDEVQDVTVQFQVGASVPDGYLLRFFVDLDDGSYSDREIFRLTVTPPLAADVFTGTVRTSITTEGNIGFVGFDGTPGSGFVHSGNNYLFEGGLLIGTGAATVSDCIRNASGSDQDVDLGPAADATITISSPGRYANEEAAILLTDSSAANPLGLTIFQETWADNRPGNEDFIIFKYTIQNNNGSDLTGVHAGLFFDWDINPTATDYARYDASRKMGYGMNNAASPARIAATRVLTGNGSVHYRSVHNPNELYDGFTDVEKWNFLSGGVQTQSLDNVDISTLIGEGPFTIPANQSVVVAFAVMGAASISELETTADAAQDFWDNPPVGIEPANDDIVTDGFALAQNYPNPFNPETTVEFGLRDAQRVSLAVYDITGRQVATLVDGRREAGRYAVRWTGRDDAGRQVASGVYLYRLTAGEQTVTRKMILLR